MMKPWPCAPESRPRTALTRVRRASRRAVRPFAAPRRAEKYSSAHKQWATLMQASGHAAAEPPTWARHRRRQSSRATAARRIPPGLQPAALPPAAAPSDGVFAGLMGGATNGAVTVPSSPAWPTNILYRIRRQQQLLSRTFCRRAAARPRDGFGLRVAGAHAGEHGARDTRGRPAAHPDGEWPARPPRQPLRARGAPGQGWQRVRAGRGRHLDAPRFTGVAREPRGPRVRVARLRRSAPTRRRDCPVAARRRP